MDLEEMKNHVADAIAAGWMNTHGPEGLDYFTVETVLTKIANVFQLYEGEVEEIWQLIASRFTTSEPTNGVINFLDYNRTKLEQTRDRVISYMPGLVEQVEGALPTFG